MEGLWDLTAGKHNKVINYITHPCDPNRNLYIIADILHLLKNLKARILNNNFLLPENIVRKYNLSRNKIQAKRLEELILAQKEFQFLLTPKV